MVHKKINLCVLLLGIGITANAQHATTASGGDASGSGGSTAYSIGQVAYTTQTSSTGTVNQGVQQTYAITVGVKEVELFNSITVFPNPVTDHLTLKIDGYADEKLTYQVFDMQGKLMESDEITGSETIIDMGQYSKATYFIKLMDKNNLIQSFKIIKK
ncbi:MAG TPA: T9SS type A sorting domain-containing protein [Brumimicrobium sp.]|nr:T9SS type A sorting domain-containing protein [Brumimicrobium sp.]